jgi:PPOX class probable FMN-dependent enzyme
MREKYMIQTEQELEDLFGQPSDLVKQKICTALDGPMREFIDRSPLLFISTEDAKGQADVSPKGDAAGFVTVDSLGRLQIPERPGNKLTFGFRNILRNPNIGLIFVVPNMRETLRLKGRATLTKDPDLLAQHSVNKKPALLCTTVEIDECFFHCGKAMIRSRVWQPDAWKRYESSLLVRQVAGLMKGDKAVEQAIEEHLEASYRDNLY